MREIDLSRKTQHRHMPPVNLIYIFGFFSKNVRFIRKHSAFCSVTQFSSLSRMNLRFYLFIYFHLTQSMSQKCDYAIHFNSPFLCVFQLLACQRMCHVCHTVWQMSGNLFVCQFWFVCVFECVYACHKFPCIQYNISIFISKIIIPSSRSIFKYVLNIHKHERKRNRRWQRRSSKKNTPHAAQQSKQQCNEFASKSKRKKVTQIFVQTIDWNRTSWIVSVKPQKWQMIWRVKRKKKKKFTIRNGSWLKNSVRILFLLSRYQNEMVPYAWYQIELVGSFN